MKRIEENTRTHPPQLLHLGIDVGSTTTKIVAINPCDDSVLFSRYKRHNACQVPSVQEALREVDSFFPEAIFRVAVCGSGGKNIADALGVPYVQEVVANSIAVRKSYENARTAIELGGQDAKVIFFGRDESTNRLTVSDMRMNGSCAGGTGAFIDEIASLLKVDSADFEELASRGRSVYDISGRCGVYAKTDIQPLLNQGVPKEDIALSTFHAIAKQTIGGLAQGIDILSPVIFEGGPLTFNPTLVKVFAERLSLQENDFILPSEPETIVARGAALSLNELFVTSEQSYSIVGLQTALQTNSLTEVIAPDTSSSFFDTPGELDAFRQRHTSSPAISKLLSPGNTLSVFLGIDSGSTTTKFVLIDEEENVVDHFYSSNEGEPLIIARNALADLYRKYQAADINLDIKAVGTTGYGELLFARAFGADYHVVETVAHAEAARKYVPDVSFILDIGGQDMKAILLDEGIITDIIINEACSSGCGSFLESFASNLNIAVEDIAEAAFSSQHPADLGSRCTVFMNSRIVTEQRNGKQPNDIMAGLCRSVIENVFTKVIRMSNLDKLGNKVVVQGGTFKNDAVLRAFEQYLGQEVTRAPYPGLMGAIGVALLCKKHAFRNEAIVSDDYAHTPSSSKSQTFLCPSSFIGLAAMESFSYTQKSNLVCPFCTNHCNRTLLTFSNGNSWITGNRCEKGAIVGDLKDDSVRAAVHAVGAHSDEVPDMFKIRESLLFNEYPCSPLVDSSNITIGLPRVLEFWNSAPFWTTFFRALGFRVQFSGLSTRKMYERGLPAVTSDTVCFPAKLVHGHLRDLVDKKVDRIFFPSITSMPSENTEKTSESVCAVVKGYPLVINSSDNPEQRWDVTFDHPLFHWYTQSDRDAQLSEYMEQTFAIPPKLSLQAIKQGDDALANFRKELQAQGAALIKEVEQRGDFAVILASRPYQNDELVNHKLSSFFTALGIPVLTADSVPGVYEQDLTGCRIDIVNNFHTRMLSSSLIAAKSPHLEYVQIVSFGCGHDAVLSDEIIRLMKETSGKTPLVLKLDESDIQGPLRIRVKSFVETIRARRELDSKLNTRALPDPYPVKYEKKHRDERVILVPNTSRAFCRIMTASMAKQGIRVEPLPLGGDDAIRLGKKYVHNDICFPAQIVIGEALAALESGLYDKNEVAIGTGKLIGDCRLTHYAALLRKALDDAGYEQVPVITNDGEDQRNMHPGYRMSVGTQIRIALSLPMIDALEELLRKIRPYESIKGSSNEAFEKALDLLSDGLQNKGVRGAISAFKQAIEIMSAIEYDRRKPRKSVLVVGEYLLNFHPGANHHVEEYLENSDLEVIEPRMTDVYRKGYFYQKSQIKEYRVKRPFLQATWLFIADELFERTLSITDRIAKRHPLYEAPPRLPELTQASDDIMHHTFDSGEGFLIPAEILHHAEKGVRSFVILQPFGCLPNHICGRGVSKRLKEQYPEANILPLDYDPDISFANIENRLQMLIMNTHDTAEVVNPISESISEKASREKIATSNFSSQRTPGIIWVKKGSGRLGSCKIDLSSLQIDLSSLGLAASPIALSALPSELADELYRWASKQYASLSDDFAALPSDLSALPSEILDELTRWASKQQNYRQGGFRKSNA